MLGRVLVLYLPRRCSPGSIGMKRNIYGSSDSLWYIVWSYTLRSFLARAGGEEEEGGEDRRRTKSIFLRFNISTSTKVSETSRVALHLNSEDLSSVCVW